MKFDQKDHDRRVALAELEGYIDIKERLRYNGIQDEFKLCGNLKGIISEIPDYLNDLNAIHELEKHLRHINKFSTYIEKLFTIVNSNCSFVTCRTHWDYADCVGFIDATARHRAEAFLRVHDKWD